MTDVRKKAFYIGINEIENTIYIQTIKTIKELYFEDWEDKNFLILKVSSIYSYKYKNKTVESMH